MRKKPTPPSDEPGAEVREQQEVRQISYEGCAADIPRGKTIKDIEAKVASGTLVTDSGGYTAFLEAFRDKEPLTDEDIDAMYRATIAAGIIDHHSVDIFLQSKGMRSEKCATQMVADYPDEVLAMIKEKGITAVDTHQDSDGDAICSAFLAKSLIEHGELPSITPELARVINQLDYGKFPHRAPEAFTYSLPGIIGAVKKELLQKQGQELGAKVFSQPEMKGPDGRLNQKGGAELTRIKKEFQDKINASVFEVLNSLNTHFAAGEQIDLSSDLTTYVEELPKAIKELIQTGQEASLEEYQQFLEVFEKAEKREIELVNSEGEPVKVQLVIADFHSPLGFTNMAYNVVAPESVIAVYGGAERSTGDNYDIGIMPEQAGNIELKEICLALNRAEKLSAEKL